MQQLVIRVISDRADKSQESLDIKRFGHMRDKAFLLHLPDIFLAILDGATAADYLPVQAAWKIDQRHAKFVKVSIEGLVCPRSAIYTVDGGP